MADSYLTLAADYDWLFDDNGLTGGDAIRNPATARLLQRTSRGCAVLDASCGTGINAAVLARRGFDVWATDGSEAMIEQAAARFRREHLEIPLRRCLWADLPGTLAERFDVVLCVGNSLVHAAGRDAMVTPHRLRHVRRPLRRDRGGELTRPRLRLAAGIAVVIPLTASRIMDSRAATAFSSPAFPRTAPAYPVARP